MPCRACGGTRLRPEALAVTVDGLSIAEAAALPIDDLRAMFDTALGPAGHPETCPSFRSSPPDRRALRRAAAPRARLSHPRPRVDDALGGRGAAHPPGAARRHRPARRAVRARRASVGLHHHDTAQLLDVLRGVRDEGNTVLVVEHDDQIIGEADWIVDVGPGAGSAGGEIVFSGPAGRVHRRRMPRRASRASGRAARGRSSPAASASPAPAVAARRHAARSRVTGVTKHNLRGVDVAFTQGVFTVVTGVSGSGKSTLLEETRRLLAGGRRRAGRRDGASADPRRRQGHRDRSVARSGGRRGPTRRPTRARSITSATCSPRTRTRSRAASARAASRST